MAYPAPMPDRKNPARCHVGHKAAIDGIDHDMIDTPAELAAAIGEALAPLRDACADPRVGDEWRQGAKHTAKVVEVNAKLVRLTIPTAAITDGWPEDREKRALLAKKHRIDLKSKVSTIAKKRNGAWRQWCVAAARAGGVVTLPPESETPDDDDVEDGVTEEP